MSLTITNYKKLESWEHDYKDFRIGEITETDYEYTFKIEYNLIPYIIKIFRNGTTTKEYEIVLRDGLNVVQYRRSWILKKHLEIDKIVIAFENIIVNGKPKAKQTRGNINFNNPF
jgi:hypothetical protein